MTAPTPPSQRRWTDERVEQVLGNLLRAGVLLAAAVVLVGGIIFVWRNGSEPSGHHVFTGEGAGLRSVAGIVSGAATFQGRYIIQLGLLLLIATPVARVAMSLVAFILQRDRLYVLITTIVLALLVFSLSGA